MRFKILFAALIMSFGTTNQALAQESPKQIVGQLYSSYLADPHAEKPSNVGALDLILPYASKGLQTAIHKNEACEKREQGICNIDFDIIINTQDWNLSDFRLIEDTNSKNHSPIIRANFSNGGKNQVSYFFVQEQGDWKIDEVEAIRYKPSGKIDYRFKLKENLMRKDP